MTIKYINRLGDGIRETVDQFTVNTSDDKEELKRLLNEYIISDKTGSYYISSRSCSNWK